MIFLAPIPNTIALLNLMRISKITTRVILINNTILKLLQAFERAGCITVSNVRVVNGCKRYATITLSFKDSEVSFNKIKCLYSSTQKQSISHKVLQKYWGVKQCGIFILSTSFGFLLSNEALIKHCGGILVAKIY